MEKLKFKTIKDINRATPEGELAYRAIKGYTFQKNCEGRVSFEVLYS